MEGAEPELCCQEASEVSTCVGVPAHSARSAPLSRVTVSLWAARATAALSSPLSPGPPKANSGRDNTRQECHRDAVALRQLSGGDHAAAAGHVPGEQAALGADAAVAAGPGSGRRADGGDFQVSSWGVVLLLSYPQNQ